MLAFDGRKEMLPVLRKGRVDDTSKDVTLTPHEKSNLRNLMAKWRDEMAGWSTMDKNRPSAQLAAIRKLVANVMHGSEAGRQMWSRVAEKLGRRFGSKSACASRARRTASCRTRC